MSGEIDIRFYDEVHFSNRRDAFAKKHGDEVSSAIKNFDAAMEFYEKSTEEALRTSGLVRREKSGVVAVDQSGSETRPPFQIRLYFYPWTDAQGKHCMILTIGEKKRQEADNNFCVRCLRRMHLK